MGHIFDLYGRLGHGGQADVYLARRRGTGTFFAAKILREAWDPFAVLAFRQEVERQVRVAGPNVVRVVTYNFGCHPPFAILELMPGGTLAERLEKSPAARWDLLSALQLIRKIAASVADLHQKGVIHLDVKPANVLFDANDNPILNDLGVAASCGTTGFVIANGFRGTPAYAAPEQFHGCFVKAADVYPLGVILYELLVGVRLSGDQRRVLWPSQLRRDVASSIDNLIRRLAHPLWPQRPTAWEAVGLIDTEILRLLAGRAMARARAQKVRQQLAALGYYP